MPVNIPDGATRAYTAYKKAVSASGVEFERSLFLDLKHWVKIAAICETIGATPERFIATQFVVLDEYRRRLMTPAGIYKPISRAVQIYRMSSPTEVDYDKLYTMLAHRLAEEPDTQKALCDPYLTYPDWFRIARIPDLTPDMLKIYFENAREEVEADAKLKLFLKKENLYERFERPAA